MRFGVKEGLPYSLSRWTDVCGSKWAWLEAQIAAGSMTAFDPRTAIPSQWSLKPEDTLGLIFWTRYPKPLWVADWVRDYSVRVHVTVTGWHEVERGAPSLTEGITQLCETVRRFGAGNVVWRFSPVPLVADVVTRFAEIAKWAAQAGVRETRVSFLQPNDWLQESRSPMERLVLLQQLAESAQRHNIKVSLCAEDTMLLSQHSLAHTSLQSAVCAPILDWPSVSPKASTEPCGCVWMVDPFTQNEACAYGCRYCYAGNQGTAPRKRNTAKRSLSIISPK